MMENALDSAHGASRKKERPAVEAGQTAEAAPLREVSGEVNDLGAMILLTVDVGM